MVERPTNFLCDARGVMHCENGPAVKFSDGMEAYYWHGVCVPKAVIMHPETLTVKDILSENNQEVRRLMMERVGYERIIDQADATLISEDNRGKLWRIPRAKIGLQSEDMVIVEVMNSTPEADGSRRRFFLRVHPTCQTPTRALEWSFNLNAGEYEGMVAES
jgi:hypothetical protein|tara:strand:- start:2278 stop:2763 length:486 start_codon:yes stop_codon:yes gene_type:complete